MFREEVTSPILTSNHHGHLIYDAIPDEEKPQRDLSYWCLLKDNVNFRWYILSSIITGVGEWFTYVASISAIEQIQLSHQSVSRTSISILVALRLLPSALCSNIGGALADSYDRRRLMIMLDLLGAVIAVFFILAHQFKSISALYAATVLQMTVAAIYEPCRSSIVPMLILEEEGLKKASTFTAVSWSVMTSVGASMGGFVTVWAGIDACFLIDSASYLSSAFLIWKIKGIYLASQASNDRADEMQANQKNDFTPCPPEATENTLHFHSIREILNATINGFSYLKSKPWGPLVFLKFCAALVYGASDVLNVAYSERYDNSFEELDSNSSLDTNADGASQRLGILFAYVGIGCFLGPFIIEPFTKMNKLSSLEGACLFSFLLMVVGCWGLTLAGNFLWVCIFSAIRSAGSSIVWIYSSLLLQTLCANHMLGRVTAVDYALAMVGEAFTAIMTGLMQDHARLSIEEVSFIMAVVASLTLISWTFYFFANHV